MPDQNLPNPLPPRPLSTSARRALGAAILGTATLIPPFACSVLVDTLDAVAWAMLGTAGTTPAEARAVLAAMWTYDRPTD
jgi:hypothetical protein